jgi:crossover junction endodeoxyribonuclease RuvC
VQPQAWKKLFGLNGADKKDSLDVARRLYPALGADLARVKDHNRSEALLLAHFGQSRLA